MKLLIVSYAPLIKENNKVYAYAPYVSEINIWGQYVTQIAFCCPTWKTSRGLLNKQMTLKISQQYETIDFDTKGIFNKLVAIFAVIYNCIQIVRGMFWADHIHLRCPGNMGLLGCILQIFFPGKIKTAKYAGNWDKGSHQPFSYKLQMQILNSTLLSKNMKVMVYGNWPGSSKNIIPFFTATYNENERISTNAKPLYGPVKLLFVGGLSSGKQPLISCKVVKQLLDQGKVVGLDLYGEGPQRREIEQFIKEYHLEDNIQLHGNQDRDTIKTAYQQAHFLVFISESEGWPKAVAEAMWWGCLPITTAVSCVPEMLGYGERGDLVISDPVEIVSKIEYYIHHPDEYNTKCKAAMAWSREYTLERFEKEIKTLIYS
jgi:glycosyltransferase involved in cell wall biosynthesis